MSVLSEKRNIMIGCACAFSGQALFGLSFLFTKHITESVDALTLLSWRLVMALILMTVCALTGIIKVNFKGKNLRPLLVISIFQPVIYFLAETGGIKLTTASESGAVIACIPIATLIASTLILKEKPTRFQVYGICVTLVGVMLGVLAKGMEATFHPLGYVLLFAAVCAASLYMVFVRKANMFTSVEITYGMIAFGAVVFTGLALFQNIKENTLVEYLTLPYANTNFLFVVLYLSLGCSVTAFLLMNIAISRIGATGAASFMGVATVVSVIAGIVVLHEQFNSMQIVGTALIITGVYIANVIKQKQEQAEGVDEGTDENKS